MNSGIINNPKLLVIVVVIMWRFHHITLHACIIQLLITILCVKTHTSVMSYYITAHLSSVIIRGAHNTRGYHQLHINTSVKQFQYSITQVIICYLQKVNRYSETKNLWSKDPTNHFIYLWIRYNIYANRSIK